MIPNTHEKWVFLLFVDFMPSLFSKSSYYHRWVVFLMDMVLCTVSAFAATSLFHFRETWPYLVNTFQNHLLVLLPLTIIVHLLLRPHMGLIRQTALYDLVKLLLVRFLVLVAAVIWVYQLHQEGHVEYLYSILVVDFLLSALMLTTLRLVIKWLFGFVGHSLANQSPILIYGAGESGNLTFNALHHNHKILAFIDDDKLKQGKRFLGKRILSLENATTEYILKGKVKVVILAMHRFSVERKKYLAELCMNNNVRLQLVPKLEDMLNQGVTPKNLRALDVQELLGRDPILLDHRNVSNALFGKTVLITGAAGSIGSEIGEQVLGFWPAKVIYLDQAETPLFYLERSLKSQESYKGIQKEFVVADICQISVLRRLFIQHKIDVVFHAAAYKHVPLMEDNPLQALYVNTWGSAQLAELSVEYGVERFVQVSTDKAVNPTNVMGASKRAAERYIQSLSTLGKTQFIITRFGNVLGSNGSVIPLFQEQLNQGGPITVTHPEITRYFMTIPEACSLVLEAGAMGRGGEIYVFDMGEPVKIRDMAENMIRLVGLKPYIDVNIVYTGLRPGEKLYEELLSDSETTMPTIHPKIMVAKVSEDNLGYFQEEWLTLLQLIQGGNSPDVLVSWLKKLVPEYISENSDFTALDEDKTMDHKNLHLTPVPVVISHYAQSHTKRWFDVAFSLLVLPCALLLLIPVFCVYPLFGGWSMIFKHYRAGLGGKKFHLYKVRSLKKNHNNPRAGMVKGDGTVIPGLGRFLRETRLDELPQIWNIIKGEMSWVGPRPEQLEFVEHCKEKFPSYDARHAIKPGITGLAQVYNPNATIDDHQEKLVHDLEYIKTASLWMDIQILWKSLKVVLKFS
jgi:FlaA1/EpsC-like NDP-sugar epimerase/lipopolysaccharide/colanic/teichoic acid biosynthesis glycosyltransferase